MQNPRTEVFKKKKGLNMSNYKLAKECGLNRQIIDNWQKNKDYKITFDSVQKICNYLEISLK